MDIREVKTKRSIKNAFLQLRAHKPLERITIKELAALAQISKATFYLHYRDIYDLSSQMQNEVVQDILDGILSSGISLLDTVRLSQELFRGFHSNQALIGILFSGNQAAVLPDSIEKVIKEYLFREHPEYENDMELNVLLTYRIYGGYYAYSKNFKQFDLDQVLDMVDAIARQEQSGMKILQEKESRLFSSSLAHQQQKTSTRPGKEKTAPFPSGKTGTV